jgi:predicted HTH transcriptional regulator
MPPLSIEMFPDRVVSVQRNPRIAQAASTLGFMDARGYGIKNMPDRMREHGLRDPEFTAESGFFSVTLYGRELTPFAIRANRQLLATLSPRQLEIVEIAESEKIIKSEDVVKTVKVSKETASRDLKRLLELKVLGRTGNGRATTYFLIKE